VGVEVGEVEECFAVDVVGLDEGGDAVINFDETGEADDLCDGPVCFTVLEEAGLLVDAGDEGLVDLILGEKAHLL
jgi:hypothetical protein